MLILRLDQAIQLLNACHNLKETLAIRYMVLNGLSPMEIATARIEHLDPIECILFLPRRHWKRNCIANIDPETVKIQAIYSADRKKGPLLRSRRTRGHLVKWALWALVKRVALRTTIPNREKVSPLILKRTFAREWLKSGGSVASLQKQFSHKHLWSTAHYLRFIMDDVRHNHVKFMRRIKHEQKTKSVRLVS